MQSRGRNRRICRKSEKPHDSMMAAMVRTSWRPSPSPSPLPFPAAPSPSPSPCEGDNPFPMDGTSPSSSSSSSLTLSPRRGRGGGGSGSKPKKAPQRGLGVAQLERLRIKQQQEEQLQLHLRRTSFPLSLYSPISPLANHQPSTIPHFAIEPFPNPACHGFTANSDHLSPQPTTFPKPCSDAPPHNPTFQNPISDSQSSRSTAFHSATFQKLGSEGLSHNTTVQKLGTEGLYGNNATQESGSGGVSSDTAIVYEQKATRHEVKDTIHETSKNSTFSPYLPDLQVSDDPNTPYYKIQDFQNPSHSTLISGFDGHQKPASGGLLGNIAIVSQQHNEEKGTFPLDLQSDSVSNGLLNTACRNPSSSSSAWVLAMPEADGKHHEPFLGFAAMDFQVTVEEAEQAVCLSEARMIDRRSFSAFPMPNLDQPCRSTITIDSPKVISCMVARPTELSSFQSTTLQPPWPFDDDQVLRKKRQCIHIKEPPAEEEIWDLNPNSTKAKKPGTHQIHKTSAASSSHKRALFPFDLDNGTFLALELSLPSSSSPPSKSDQSTSQQIAGSLLQSSDSVSGMLSTEDDRFRPHHSSSNSEQMKSNDGAPYLRTLGTIDLPVENMKEKCLMKYLWATQEEEEKPMMMMMQVDHMDLDLKLSLL